MLCSLFLLHSLFCLCSELERARFSHPVVVVSLGSALFHMVGSGIVGFDMFSVDMIGSNEMA